MTQKTLPLILAALLTAACKQEEGPKTPVLSAPDKPSASGIARRLPAKTVTASSGPVHITLELLALNAQVDKSTIFFSATLKNLGTRPRSVTDALFWHPDEMIIGSSIYLEVIDPNGKRLNPIRQIGMGAPPPDDMPDEELKIHDELVKGVKNAETSARKKGLDPDAAATAFITDFNSRHGLEERSLSRELKPGETITTPTWTYSHSKWKQVPGYAELPFRLERPGHYKVRLVYDYEFLNKLRRNGRRLDMPEALRLTTEYIPLELTP